MLAGWVPSICRLFFADEFIRRKPSSDPSPRKQALKVVPLLLQELELQVIEFLAEWMVTLIMPAKKLIQLRSPYFLLFILRKAYWFREIYLSLKITGFSSKALRTPKQLKVKTPKVPTSGGTLAI